MWVNLHVGALFFVVQISLHLAPGTQRARCDHHHYL